MKQKKCCKKPDSPSYILLTNCQESFQNTNVFEIGRSNFHKMTGSVLKLHFPKQKLNIVLIAAIKGSVIAHLELNLLMNC